RTFVFALAATGCGASASAAALLPRDSSVPGGVARIALGAAAERPVAHQEQVPLLVVGNTSAWTAVVGIPLTTQPGPAQIEVQSADGMVRTIEYVVRPKKYLEQRLRVAPGQVELSPADQLLRLAPSVQRPGARATRGHGHRGGNRYAGQGSAGREGARYRRLLL